MMTMTIIIDCDDDDDTLGRGVEGRCKTVPTASYNLRGQGVTKLEKNMEQKPLTSGALQRLIAHTEK